MSVNYDLATVEGFGDEWSRFDQTGLSNEELLDQFNQYFKIFPWSTLPAEPIGFDLGCGSGRWAKIVAPRVSHLYCIDASQDALEVARRNLQHCSNCTLVRSSVDSLSLADNSMDFGYSLGVLHHVPDTAAGIRSCVAKLKPGAPFLLYLYYAFDNRPTWFRLLWRFSDIIRRAVARLPFLVRYGVTQLIAGIVYLPLARAARLLEKCGFNVDAFPLSTYRHRSFYMMRTDALDRFGTRLEQRFTVPQIRDMMENAGLERIQFSDTMPCWCAVGYKKTL